MSPHLDLPHFKDPHIAASHACTITNHSNALDIEDHSNWTQFKETVMTAEAEMIGKNCMKKCPLISNKMFEIVDQQ